MDKNIEVYRSKNFEDDINLLSFKESNFSFKQTRNLVEMLKSGLNVSHLSAIDKPLFNKPLYALKIQKDLRVLLILEENTLSTAYKLTLLRVIRLHDLDEALDKISGDEECSPFEFVFNGFW